MAAVRSYSVNSGRLAPLYASGHGQSLDPAQWNAIDQNRDDLEPGANALSAKMADLYATVQ